jgi:tRNA 5-methylaminomethyl-2-thiouridine biosynthesis bifunctional protein
LQEDKTILLLDKEEIASGGSGAAGAFVAPKFAKSGELKELMHDSFLYSMSFYTQNFPTAFSKVKLLHSAIDEKTSQMLQAYKETTTLIELEKDDEVQKISSQSESIFLEAGVVDAKKMCENLSEGVTFTKMEVNSLSKEGDFWILNGTLKSKNVILATGAYNKIVDEEYIKIRGIWGHRIEIKTSTKNNYSLHKYLSISPSKNGIMAIGATHNLNYHPQTSKESYNIEEGRVELLEKANKMLELNDVEIVKDFVGLRSGSVDYMPMIGSLVDSKATYEKEINLRTKRVSYDEFSYHKGLYIINGSSGYGFVFAPYLAKILKEHILNDTKIAKNIDIARYFAREARK